MRKPKRTNAELKYLVALLADTDGMIRERARESLVDTGKGAVLSLIKALQTSPLDQVRWEAAKALGAIDDTRSMLPLVNALKDSNDDVAWLAAEGLRKYKRDAWQPLLRLLIKQGSESAALRNAAHHVFLNQEPEGFEKSFAALMKALETVTVPEAVAVAAYEMLKAMKDSQ